MKTRRRNRLTRSANSGLTSSVTTTVPMNSQRIDSMPRCMPRASRAGRTTMSAVSTQKKKSPAITAGAASSRRIFAKRCRKARLTPHSIRDERRQPERPVRSCIRTLRRLALPEAPRGRSPPEGARCVQRRPRVSGRGVAGPRALAVRACAHRGGGRVRREKFQRGARGLVHGRARGRRHRADPVSAAFQARRRLADGGAAAHAARRGQGVLRGTAGARRGRPHARSRAGCRRARRGRIRGACLRGRRAARGRGRCAPRLGAGERQHRRGSFLWRRISRRKRNRRGGARHETRIA